ncbi:Uncharacterised protein r2_g435 [Pycnogonum litorale]
MNKRDLLAIFVLTSLAFVLETVIGCSCKMSHPQQHYCQADYVIQAKIVRNDVETGFSYKGVHIRIKKTYKSTNKARLALKSRIIWTSTSSSLCGVSLEENQKYIMAGNLIGSKAWLSLCDYAVKWNSLTRKQKKGFKILYHHGCVCQIVPCPDFILNCSESKKVCRWDSLYDGRYDCESLQSFCIPQRSGRCEWNRSKIYNSCRKVREKVMTSRRIVEP